MIRVSKARITYFFHDLIYKDNCSVNSYTFESFFPVLAARIRVKMQNRALHAPAIAASLFYSSPQNK